MNQFSSYLTHSCAKSTSSGMVCLLRVELLFTTTAPAASVTISLETFLVTVAIIYSSVSTATSAGVFSIQMFTCSSSFDCLTAEFLLIIVDPTAEAPSSSLTFTALSMPYALKLLYPFVKSSPLTHLLAPVFDNNLFAGTLPEVFTLACPDLRPVGGSILP